MTVSDLIDRLEAYEDYFHGCAFININAIIDAQTPVYFPCRGHRAIRYLPLVTVLARYPDFVCLDPCESYAWMHAEPAVFRELFIAPVTSEWISMIRKGLGY